MKTAICVPYREHPARDHLWRFTREWISKNYPQPVFTADSGGVKFSRGRARNLAAKLAGNWDVAVFHDSDTIAHPDAITQAIDLAATSMRMVVTADSHMYCDEPSTKRILESGVPQFARPASFDAQGIYQKPCSGIVAVNRDVFDAVGGYVELEDWGYEDLVFLQSCGLFAQGNTWVPGHINLHLYHPPAERTEHTKVNEQAWQSLAKFRRHRDISGARKYLASLGHTVP